MYRRQLLQLLGTAGLSCSEAGQTDQLIDVGGYRLHARTWGAGDPFVAIDVGIGEAVDPWMPVIERVRRSTRVCAYERAGYGRSEPGPFPRNAGRVAEELRVLISKLVPRPPHILIGHSLGAVHVMTLATRHPALVAGLLLLDPPPRGFVTGERFPSLKKMASAQTSEFRRMAADAQKQKETGKAAFFETLASEHESLFAEAGAEVAQVRTLGAIPVVVIGSEVANPMFGPEAEDFQRFWIESNNQIAGLSSSGKFVLARGSTHQIHRDAPDVVVREAMELVAIARSAAR